MSQFLLNHFRELVSLAIAALGWWTAHCNAEGARRERERARDQREAKREARMKAMVDRLTRGMNDVAAGSRNARSGCTRVQSRTSQDGVDRSASKALPSSRRMRSRKRRRRRST